ncbi:MAG: hypothetical protein Q9O24_00245 [Gammaproteobacteria bacterium]|nr:hypothetical protein [Gammaproteobacteria bacterium]
MNHEKNESHEKEMEQYFFRASAEDFKKIPGSPVAYWVSHALAHCFSKGALMSNITPPKKGIDTGSNDAFLRFWFEPIKSNITFKYSLVDMDVSRRWFRYNKGGGFRKWFGNNYYVVNWENNGELIKSFSRSTIRNEKFLRKKLINMV